MAAKKRPARNGKTKRGRIRKNIRLGASSAELDDLLHDAFVDVGFLETLADIGDSRSVVVGRTGAGKSALLLRLEETQGEDRCIRVRPEALSMQYISNSTMIPQLTSLGVHLELFYKLLWRHVFFVQLIGRRFGLGDAERDSRFRRFLTQLSDPGAKKCFKYFEQFGTSYWDHSEEIVRKLVTRLEKQIKGRLKGELGIASGDLEASTTRTTETSEEVRQLVQGMVNDLQVKELLNALNVLRDNVLDDPARRYYVVLDGLDKSWVDQAYAFDLLHALLEETQEFAALANVKIVLALREDILRGLYDQARRKKWLQREKYEQLCIRLGWTDDQLVDLVDRRTRLAFDGNAKGSTTLRSLLPRPRRTGRGAPLTYLLERTWQRPRDLIHFLNDCLDSASGRDDIGWKQITAAEAGYSRRRLDSLEDEWGELYPGLRQFIESLRGIDERFLLDEFDLQRVYDLVEQGEHEEGTEARLLYDLYAREMSDDQLRAHVLTVLFDVGALGVRLSQTDPPVFCHQEPHLCDNGFPTGTGFHVHPALWRALGVRRVSEQA